MLKNVLKVHSLILPVFKNVQLLKTSQHVVSNYRHYVKRAEATAVVVEEKKTENNQVNPFARVTGDLQQLEVQQPSMGTEEEERRLKVLQLELDIANQEGRRVPTLDFMQANHWAHVLTMKSKSARQKYYKYLWQLEKKIESKLRKKEERAVYIAEKKVAQRAELEQCNHIIYGLSHTSFFLRIYDSTINYWQNNRLINAMQFAPKVVLDCGYDEHMTNREAKNASKQLMLSFAENRSNSDPFDLHFSNVNLKSVCMQSLQRYIPTMLNPEFPMNVHEKCFTEIFPKEKIVYLTPHCRTDLKSYNSDDIYIIGAMVDTINNEPLSLARAKRMGLRMARLPLDNYLQWGSGSGKSLTLNQMINILLDLKATGDWMTALRHVPRRKVVNMELDALRQKRTMKHRSNKLNLRLEKILNFENERRDTNRGNSVTIHKDSAERKPPYQFNLETWASKKER